jgi:hypothetical protein
MTDTLFDDDETRSVVSKNLFDDEDINARSTVTVVVDTNDGDSTKKTGEFPNCAVIQNVFNGYYAGQVKIECITPQLFQWNDQGAVFISSQLGRMFPNMNMTNEIVAMFVETIARMKKDFKGYVGNEFEKETTTYAQVMGMVNPQTGKSILSWSEFGNEFIQTPGYLEAARWWMCMYGARDRDSEKEARYEAEWMKTCRLTYVSLDEKDMQMSGLQKIARMRLNNITKAANGKLREAIGFGISKSIPMIVNSDTKKRKQAERRVKSVFRKSFVRPWAKFKNGDKFDDFLAYLDHRKATGMPVGEDFGGESLSVDWFYQSIYEQSIKTVSNTAYVPSVAMLSNDIKVSKNELV